jgi:hypothetical protein
VTASGTASTDPAAVPTDDEAKFSTRRLADWKATVFYTNPLKGKCLERKRQESQGNLFYTNPLKGKCLERKRQESQGNLNQKRCMIMF